MVLKKATVQVLLLLIGMAMLVFGIWRDEAQTVCSVKGDTAVYGVCWNWLR